MALHFRSAKSILQLTPHIRCVPYVTQINSDKHASLFDGWKVNSQCLEGLLSQRLNYKEQHVPLADIQSQTHQDIFNLLQVSTDAVSLFTKDLRTPYRSSSSLKTTPVSINTSRPVLHRPPSLACNPNKCLNGDASNISQPAVGAVFDDVYVSIGKCSLPFAENSGSFNAKNSSLVSYCDGSKPVLEAYSEELSQDSKPQKPSNEHLSNVKEYVIHSAPVFFKKKHDYRLYHKDVIFENNLFGQNKVTNGMNAYAIQLLKLRFLSHCAFTEVGMSVIKITLHPEDNTVRVNWRVSGVPQLKTLTKFWKFNPWQYRKTVKEESKFYDGFSTFHVGTDGLIYKHRIDKVMPDEGLEGRENQSLAFKLALIFGLVPRPGLQDFSGLFCKKNAVKSPIII